MTRMYVAKASTPATTTSAIQPSRPKRVGHAITTPKIEPQQHNMPSQTSANAATGGLLSKSRHAAGSLGGSGSLIFAPPRIATALATNNSTDSPMIPIRWDVRISSLRRVDSNDDEILITEMLAGVALPTVQADVLEVVIVLGVVDVPVRRHRGDDRD